MKTCNKCQRSLPLEDFHRHKGFKDGRRKVCKACSCQNSKKYYANNREKHLEVCRDWQNKNREKVQEYQRQARRRSKEVARRWIVNNPERAKAQKKLNYAVFKGELERSEKCQVCGCVHRNIQAHHYDYSKPLEVIWVCTGCHGWIHRKRPAEKEVACS